ncbi:unnamed protein product [Leuciscus chuanchicus]
MNVCGNRRIFLELSLSLQPVEGGEIGGKRKVVKRDCLSYENLSPLWLEETVEQELERGEKSGKGETRREFLDKQSVKG